MKQYEILLVEDNDMVRDSMVYALKKRFKKVHIARCGQEGFEAYKQFHPQIIISDIDMPNVDGIEMIKKIRADGSSVPIVVNSAVYDANIQEDATSLGICKYILKPTDIKQLLTTLQQSLQKHYESDALDAH